MGEQNSKHQVSQPYAAMASSAGKLTNVIPSIAQLVERRTVVWEIIDILRSLVRIRLEGIHVLCGFKLNPQP